ncbi:hypothetical protein V8F06_003600 [Rhypophila decipiens]
MGYYIGFFLPLINCSRNLNWRSSSSLDLTDSNYSWPLLSSGRRSLLPRSLPAKPKAASATKPGPASPSALSPRPNPDPLAPNILVPARLTSTASGSPKAPADPDLAGLAPATTLAATAATATATAHPFKPGLDSSPAHLSFTYHTDFLSLLTRARSPASTQTPRQLAVDAIMTQQSWKRVFRMMDRFYIWVQEQDENLSTPRFGHCCETYPLGVLMPPYYSSRRPLSSPCRDVLRWKKQACPFMAVFQAPTIWLDSGSKPTASWLPLSSSNNLAFTPGQKPASSGVPFSPSPTLVFRL